MKRHSSLIVVIGLFFLVMNSTSRSQNLRVEDTRTKLSSGETLHLSYETTQDILIDFLSGAKKYRMAQTGQILQNPLDVRKLELAEGRFGKALHIKDGWSVSKGTSNESGLDCDLIVATIWGEWHTKPHYWGAGRFHGERGTVAFWVKTSALNPGIVFMQGSISWGRMERDLFRVDVDSNGVLSASIRDIFYKYHKIESKKPVWKNGEWQHIAVVYNQAYGLKMYHNAELIASNWGEDAWWQTTLPGLFSPFLPESFYDEICFFERPLESEEINSLYIKNSIPGKPVQKIKLDAGAQERLLGTYADLDKMDLPALNTNRQRLIMKQTQIADCHDEKIPAWWVLDGRYELAWPHPYLLFTFILGDADFHGNLVDIDFEKGETANYAAFEGVLDGIEVFASNPGNYENGKRVVDLNGYPDYFFSSKIDLGSSTALHLPMVKGYGTPPGLIDRGSLNLPLSGKIRLHEMQLWNVTAPAKNEIPENKADIVWYLSSCNSTAALDRYEAALKKLKPENERAVLLGSLNKPDNKSIPIEVGSLEAINLFSPDLNPDLAIDKIAVQFSVIPANISDVMWLKVRDPANPARIWAQTCIRLKFQNINQSQKIDIIVDINDLMLASEDRLWIELKFAGGEQIVMNGENTPQVQIFLSKDRKKSLALYTKHELMPALVHYIKEYNYQPWVFEGDPASILNWSNFGGPYDMVYPPQAVLRHDPENRLGNIYRQLTTGRATLYGEYSYQIGTTTTNRKLELPSDIPVDAPAWAIWEREVYKKLLTTVHWIARMQRKDGSFWGGLNDDTFFPLGYTAIPLMGDTISTKAFLRMYDAVEEAGIFKNGYCDIFPIDQLHITDFITSRGLMLAYALGDPHVVEREIMTAGVYDEIMQKNNAERSRKGLEPFLNTPEQREKEPKLWGEKLCRDYEMTFVNWYWGKTDKPDPHRISDRNKVARKMMEIVLNYDETAAYNWTESRTHTDRQGGAPGREELISAALGGRMQGRIEPFPHANAVSWDNGGPDLARLISTADDKQLIANVYNFKTISQKMTMKVWRLRKGEYQLRMGIDQNDDGEIDSPGTLLRNDKINLVRFSDIELTLPPQINIAICLKLIKPIQQMDDLPDMAINSMRDIIQEGNKLKVTVHNLGNALSKNINVVLLDKNNTVIAEKIIREILPPTDLKPKMETILFDGNIEEWHKVQIDRKNEIEELYEKNNEAVRVQ